MATALLLLALTARSGGVSFPNLTSAATSTTTSVTDPADQTPDVNFKAHSSPIAADGLYHHVDDIYVSEYDPVYTYELTRLEVVDNGSVGSGTCDSHDYRLGTGSDIETGVGFVFDGILQDTGRTLELEIASGLTQDNCVIHFGVVEATFQIWGP